MNPSAAPLTSNYEQDTVAVRTKYPNAMELIFSCASTSCHAQERSNDTIMGPQQRASYLRFLQS